MHDKKEAIHFTQKAIDTAKDKTYEIEDPEDLKDVKTLLDLLKDNAENWTDEIK